MKNLIYALFCAVILVGCTKDSDPTPATPTTPVYIGYWKFVSATVTPATGSAYTVNSLCSSSSTPTFKVEFKLTTTSDATQKSPCLADAALTYTGTVSNNKLTSIDFKDSGLKAYTFTNVVIDETSKKITANQTFPIGTAQSIAVIFQLQ